jgi:tRNA-dihydrouridine synthase
MEDVSDPPFRRLCKMHGADMMYSEFISEGLIRDAIKSRMKLDILIMKDLLEFRFLRR